jgi:ribosomal protein S18 acetylase RimI-like enzyme
LTAIIELDLQHYNQIIKLWQDAKLPHKPKGRDSYELLKIRLSQSATRIFGIVKENDMLIASILISHDGQRGWINRITVHPLFQRKGYAKQLLNYAEDYFRKAGIMLWSALIENENHESQEFFSKQGYTKHEEIRYYSKRESADY